jgi:hypothetical protein
MQQPRQHFDGGGFSRTVGPEETEECACLDIQVKFINGIFCAEPLRQLLRLYCRRHGVSFYFVWAHYCSAPEI